MAMVCCILHLEVKIGFKEKNLTKPLHMSHPLLWSISRGQGVEFVLTDCTTIMCIIGPEHMKEFATDQLVMDKFKEVSLKRVTYQITGMDIATSYHTKIIIIVTYKLQSKFQKHPQRHSFVCTLRM